MLRRGEERRGAARQRSHSGESKLFGIPGPKLLNISFCDGTFGSATCCQNLYYAPDMVLEGCLGEVPRRELASALERQCFLHSFYPKKLLRRGYFKGRID